MTAPRIREFDNRSHREKQSRPDPLRRGHPLIRERHFPATIADLYDPDKMPDDLRAAHDRNNEVLERIDIFRRLKNDID